MSTKIIYSPKEEEDKQELQKQLGCMNGIFQLFDRRYLLGQRRPKNLPQGQNEDGNKEFINTSEKPKENPKTANKVAKEKHRVSVESSRNSFSSSCSSLDCSKRVQTEQSSFCPSLISEPSSPISKKQPDLSADIRDVVKDSMTRKPRVVPVKTVAKEERKGPAMTHVDSPRPLQQQEKQKQHLKHVSYDRKDQNLARLREISRGVKEVKDISVISRFSCDGTESPYKLKSIKELPRLSLDSKQSSIKKNRILMTRESYGHGGGEPKTAPRTETVDQTHEPGSNKRPPSSVVARLMGLEVLHDFIDKDESLKISILRSRKGDESKSNISVSPKRVIGNARIPLEPAPWKQESGQKQPAKNKNKKASERFDHGCKKVDHGCHSVYGEIEKRLTEVEFNTSGKDLRALKQILEAIQRTKMKLEKKDQDQDQDFDPKKNIQPVSPTINKIRPTGIKPANLASDSIRVKKVNHTGDRTGRRITRNTTAIETKATVRTRKSTSPSKLPEYPSAQNYWNSRNSRSVSPRLQKSKNGIQKQSVCGPSSNGRLTGSELNARNSKMIRSINRVQTNEQCGYRSDTRDLSQQGDMGSFPSESDASVTSLNEMEVTSADWTGENNSVYQPRENYKNKYAEKLIEYKPMAELAMPTMEQPSPVSVLDAFYTEDAPSPIQKKSYAFKDDEDLRFDEPEWNQVGIDNLVSSTELDQPSSSSRFSHLKIDNIKHLVHQIELLSSNNDEEEEEEEEEAIIDQSEFFPHEVIINEDHKYIKQILLASGLLKNLDCATTIIHLNPTSTLINPELFNVLEKTKESTNEYNKRRRKMIFDTVNNILVEKLARSASSGLWKSKRKAGSLNGDKLLKELWSEINNLQTNTAGGIYDEILNIISSDVNKRSEDWDDNCNEVPEVVLDIERLIYKDLISEIVNAKVTSLQDGPERHCRQLFLF